MNQSQREALLDLLIVSIFIDSHLSLKEDEALQAAFETVGWEGVMPRDIFICISMSHARRASESDAATSEYIAARTKVFPDAASQAAALDLLQRIFAADGVAPAEESFLSRVKAAF